MLAEVFAGKRAPSYRVFTKITVLLGLSRAEREHFRYLVVRDHPRFDRTVDTARIEALLKRSRANLRPARHRRLAKPLGERRGLEHWPRVFAAAGERRTVSEVSARARLPETIVREALGGLAEVGLVAREGNDVFVSESAHVTLDPALHREIIERSLLADCASLPGTIRARYDDPEQFVFSGAIAIRPENLVKLKRRLKSEFTRAIDEYFDAEGEAVVSLHGLVLK